MFSKSILTLFLFFLILLNIKEEANACCFTMPPKVVKISKWTFSLPNIDSSSYIHESHQCPNGYNLELQHSNIVASMSSSHQNIIDLKIYGYSVCCEKKIIYINENKKNETINF